MSNFAAYEVGTVTVVFNTSSGGYLWSSYEEMRDTLASWADPKDTPWLPITPQSERTSPCVIRSGRRRQTSRGFWAQRPTARDAGKGEG